MSANLLAIFYLISGVLFILALRGLSSPETSRQGNLFGIIGMAIAIGVTILSAGNFSLGFLYLIIFLLVGGSILYGWFSLQERIANLEKEVLEANDEIRNLMAKHQLEESAQLEELENKLKFYEKELNINPLSWRKRKKK